VQNLAQINQLKNLVQNCLDEALKQMIKTELATSAKMEKTHV
jgi:hypothetical protein